jgi:hypothetical protein
MWWLPRDVDLEVSEIFVIRAGGWTPSLAVFAMPSPLSKPFSCRRAPVMRGATGECWRVLDTKPRSVDSRCESRGRPHAPRGDCCRHRHRRMGVGRTAPAASPRTLPGIRNRFGRSALRMCGPRRRSRDRAAGGLVRDRDERHHRRGRDRCSVGPAESASGLTALGGWTAWK